MLVLGKNYTKSDPSKVGGVIVLFEMFKKELKKNQIAFEVIDLNWRNYSNIVMAYFFIIWQILIRTAKHSHISFHGTANEFIYLAPFVVFVSKLYRKDVSLRKFAGSFREIFKKMNFLQQRLVAYALINADAVFFETKYLVQYFKVYNPHTYWFPNVREKALFHRSKDRPYQKKIVFLGHVRTEKGIDEILEAVTLLGAEYTIDLYGPLADRKYNDHCWDKYLNVFYRGIFAPQEVYGILINYDIALLPSYWQGEGYPGVIIEALACGLPVIASSLEGIQEMIRHGENGLLVEPKNSQELADAIKMIDQSNYRRFSERAKASFELFDSEAAMKRFLENIRAC